MLLSLLISLIYLLGVISAAHAVISVRSSQGAIAWALSLLIMPYLALPIYWVFGRNHFHGYIEVLRDIQKQHNPENNSPALQHLKHHQVDLPFEQRDDFNVLADISRSVFTQGNHLELLINGEATFKAILTAIDRAEEYVLFQSFIIRDDEVGQQLLTCLLKKAKQGINIKVLFDEIGSHALDRQYLETLQQAGIEVSKFHSNQGFTNRFQLNFRNHRKIVVVDGGLALVGGLNIGDEYLGKGPLGHWRDTHLQIKGPAVIDLQQIFAEDWFWAKRMVLPLNWQPRIAGEQTLLIHATGPADSLDACSMFFHQCIVAAKQRIWIASPYFVPSQPVFEALQLAALRGVDVRILLPNKPDHLMVYLASFSFLETADLVGIKIYRYQRGFLHQKVVLVDHEIAAIGTANLDNRSLHLNFEVMAVVADQGFVEQVDEMLQQDFIDSKQTSHTDLLAKGWLFRLAVRLARLFDPIL